MCGTARQNTIRSTLAGDITESGSVHEEDGVPELKPLVFMLLDLDTFVGSERLIADDQLRAYVYYTSAHELQPEASEPLYYMGLMQQSQGAAELAQESFAKALRVEPTVTGHSTGPQDLLSRSDAETAQWYYRLADDLKAQGYDDNAERIYRALLAWQPAEHRTRYLLGNLPARMKRWEDAVTEYLHIPAYDPYYVVARLRVAAVLRLASGSSTPTTSYTSAQRRDPTRARRLSRWARYSMISSIRPRRCGRSSAPWLPHEALPKHIEAERPLHLVM